MSTVEAHPSAATEALAERLFMATIDTLEIASVHIGGRLGFYRALAEGGAATPAELAARTGTAERYVREWLEQQAVAGFLTSRPGAEPDDAPLLAARRAPPGLRRRGGPQPHHPARQLVVGVSGRSTRSLEAYRSGAGVPYEAYGADTREGIAAINRPQFHNLVADWLALDPGDRRAPARRAAGARRRSRLRDGLVEHRDRAGVPEATVDAIDEDADVDRGGAPKRRGGRPDRTGAAGRPRRERPGARAGATTWSRSSRRCTT